MGEFRRVVRGYGNARRRRAQCLTVSLSNGGPQPAQRSVADQRTKKRKEVEKSIKLDEVRWSMLMNRMLFLSLVPEG